MNATGVAAQGDDLLVVGSPFFVIDRSGEGEPRDDAIGLMRNRAGELSIVPSPLPGRELRELRVLASRDGGWHAVFVTGVGKLGFYDSADIWYAHYDGRSWTEMQRIATARKAAVDLRYASNLVEADQGLSFAYVFDQSESPDTLHNGTARTGIVLLRKNGDLWLEDTLPTWEAPRSIQLSVYNGTLRAIFAQGYFVRPRRRGPALFVADHEGIWKAPRLIYDPDPENSGAREYVSDVVVPKNGADGLHTVLRTTRQGPDIVPLRVEWGVMDGDSVIRHWYLTEEDPSSLPAAVSIGGNKTITLIRDGDSKERLKIFVVSDAGVQDLGVLTVPNMNFWLPVAALSDDRVVAVTVGSDAVYGAERSLMTSYFTEFNVRCVAGRD